jgi:hypothetical protein
LSDLETREYTRVGGFVMKSIVYEKKWCVMRKEPHFEGSKRDEMIFIYKIDEIIERLRLRLRLRLRFRLLKWMR